MKQEKRNIKETIRLNEQEYYTIKSKADKLGMSLSSYIRDSVVTGKERTLWGKRKFAEFSISVSHNIDILQNLIVNNGQNYPHYNELISCISELRKAVDKIWH